MSQLSVRRASLTPLPSQAQSAIRWIGTNNPFYVISAGLFLAGLWLSFGDPDQAEDTWALMVGLVGYTLLLAGTAYVLVRFANVWDDARTVLLMVVLMFLATSVTFDRVIVDDVVKKTSDRGIACVLMGLAMSILVSEGLLRGIGLALPLLYRVPYYAILCLFFLYPLALIPLLQRNEPRGEEIMWGLFGFSSAAGLVFLTLLPAIWRGERSLLSNGSPWPWPLYPWSLFGLLALAVPGRAILLCYSMHLIDVRDLYDSIFGLYFLVPFGIALAILLLEMGLVRGNAAAVKAALLVPAGLFVLTGIGLRADPIHALFLKIFEERLGAGPAVMALGAAACFYTYASLRKITYATEYLTAALVLIAFTSSRRMMWDGMAPWQQLPLLTAAVVQLGIGIGNLESWRCLLGCMLALASLVLPADPATLALRIVIALNLAMLAVLVLGALFDDKLGRMLRSMGASMALVGSLAALFLPLQPPHALPAWTLDAYPLIMMGLLLGFGLWLRHTASLIMAGILLLCWLVASGSLYYRAARQTILGLDYLVLSLVLFILATAISLGKSGLLSRWLVARQAKASQVLE